MAMRMHLRRPIRAQQTRPGEFSMIWCLKLDNSGEFFTLILKNNSAAAGGDAGKLKTLVENEADPPR